MSAGSTSSRCCEHRVGVGLPNPNLKIEKFGNVPPFDPANPTMVNWAFETTLDVEYAHAIAPGAKIVLAETRWPRSRAPAASPSCGTRSRTRSCTT